jgi:hypothetical protein
MGKGIKQVKGRKALQDLANSRAEHGLVVSAYEKAYALGRTHKPCDQLSQIEIWHIEQLDRDGKFPAIWGVIKKD